MRSSPPKEVYSLREVAIMTGEPYRIVRYRAKKGWLSPKQPAGYHGKHWVTLENLQREFPENWMDLIAKLELGQTAPRWNDDFEHGEDDF